MALLLTMLTAEYNPAFFLTYLLDTDPINHSPAVDSIGEFFSIGKFTQMSLISENYWEATNFRC